MSILHNPPSIQWELTAECNHDCIHCYNYWRKDFEKIASLSKMKTEGEYLQIARRIVELRPVSVTLTGGEPLLVFDRIKSSIELLQQNQIVVSINTNAVMLTDEICTFLRQRGIHLFVSFPCANPDVCDEIVNKKGAFLKIVKGLDLAKSYGIDFANNIVVSTKNLAYVEESVDFLVERYGCRYVSVTRVGKPINSDASFDSWMLYNDGTHKLLDTVVKLHKKHPGLVIGTACPYTPCSLNSQEAFDLYGYQKICTAGKTSFAIDTDGNFKACPRDSRLYGNILEQDFSTIYANMHEWRDGSFVPKECKDCKELPRCLGGCRTDAIPFTSRSDALDCISDPSNLPLKYTPKPRVHDIGRNKFVYTGESIVCIIDKDAVRLSHGRNYVIITPKLFNFLETYGKEFTSEDLSRAFGKDTSITDNVIGRLLSERIIKLKGG